MPGQFLDVDSPVPKRSAFLVRLGNFGLEGDNPFKPWLEIRHLRPPYGLVTLYSTVLL
jgi:hypothetical protein